MEFYACLISIENKNKPRMLLDYALGKYKRNKKKFINIAKRILDGENFEEIKYEIWDSMLFEEILDRYYIFAIHPVISYNESLIFSDTIENVVNAIRSSIKMASNNYDKWYNIKSSWYNRFEDIYPKSKYKNKVICNIF
jgi:hypothetical protein